MQHSHPPVQLVPILKRLDRHFGGAWSKLDINDRARDWAKHLSAAPLASIDSAVDHLIERHEGHYPRLALVRRLALEDMNRKFPNRDTGAEVDRCSTCGEMPGWHDVARRKLPDPLPLSWPAEFGTATVLRLVTRHRIGFPCQRFNAAYQFADGEPKHDREAA